MINGMRLYLRQGDIVFSQKFIDTLRSEGVVLTRRSHFKRNGILLNHGNTKPYTLGKNVSRFYVLNKPDAIRYCSDKIRNYNILKDYYPESFEHPDNVNIYPILAKPYGGHHGYGIQKIEDRNWKVEYVGEVLQKLAKKEGMSNAKFFMLLRVAITGKKITPPLNESMEILGKHACLERLNNV